MPLLVFRPFVFSRFPTSVRDALVGISRNQRLLVAIVTPRLQCRVVKFFNILGLTSLKPRTNFPSFVRRSKTTRQMSPYIDKGGKSMTAQTLFSLAALHTVSGASMAILLVVQLIKGLPVINLIPTKCLAIVIGILLFLITSPLPSSF